MRRGRGLKIFKKSTRINKSNTIQKKTATTAILIFSRHSKEEARAKKWGRHLSCRGGEALASGLIQHTLNEAKSSGLPVLPFFSDKQKGKTFGERLTHAIAQGFAAGYQQLIVCSTDTPFISSTQLKGVASLVNKYDLVLGPSPDGGVYLLALNKAAFDKKAFLQIPWLTASVFTSLKIFAQSHHLSFAIEQEAADIDNNAAVSQHALFYPAHWFSLFVKDLLFTFKKAKQNLVQSLFISQYSFLAPAFRGPPLCFSSI